MDNLENHAVLLDEIERIISIEFKTHLLEIKNILKNRETLQLVEKRIEYFKENVLLNIKKSKIINLSYVIARCEDIINFIYKTVEE